MSTQLERRFFLAWARCVTIYVQEGTLNPKQGAALLDWAVRLIDTSTLEELERRTIDIERELGALHKPPTPA